MKISVCMSVFRSPAMLLQSAGSVLAQTHRDLEFLIGVNPQEPEGQALLKTILMLRALDERVRVVDCREQPDGFAKGVKVLQAATCEWVAGIDYDELWYPEKLERQLPYLKTFDVVSTGGQYFGIKQGVINVPSGELTFEHFRRENPVVSTSTIMRRADALRFDPAYREWAFDYKLYVDLLNLGRRFFALPDVLVLHRLHQEATYNCRHCSDVIEHIQSLVRGGNRS